MGDDRVHLHVAVRRVGVVTELVALRVLDDATSRNPIVSSICTTAPAEMLHQNVHRPDSPNGKIFMMFSCIDSRPNAHGSVTTMVSRVRRAACSSAATGLRRCNKIAANTETSYSPRSPGNA